MYKKTFYLEYSHEVVKWLANNEISFFRNEDKWDTLIIHVGTPTEKIRFELAIDKLGFKQLYL